MGRHKKIVETANSENTESANSKDTESVNSENLEIEIGENLDSEENILESDIPEENSSAKDNTPAENKNTPQQEKNSPVNKKSSASQKCCRCHRQIYSSSYDIKLSNILGAAYYHTDNVPERVKLCKDCCMEWCVAFEKWYFKAEDADKRLDIKLS